MTKIYNVAGTLYGLGISYQEVSGEYRAQCPMHEKNLGREDNNPSWYINPDTGLHICFSCGYRGSLQRLIADIRGIDMGQAQAYLIESRQEISADLLRKRLKKATTFHVPTGSEFLPESSLARFDDVPDEYLKRRQLTAEGARRFGLMWESETLSWITPIRDPMFSRLMGWQTKSQRSRYFRNRPAGVQKSRTLFGWHLVTTIETEVWVVESPLDAVRLATVDIPAVATFGTAVSEQQMGLLSALDHVVLAFDNDEAGDRATKNVLEKARKLGMDVSVVDLPTGCKDPGDCTDKELLAVTPRHMVRL